MWELLFDGIADLMLHFGPRWMRVGCTILLGLIVAALLIGALYLWIFV